MLKLQSIIRSILLVLLIPILASAAGKDSAGTPGERMSILVLPCESAPALADMAQITDDLLVKAILEKKRFRVVEKEKLMQIMQEQKLSREKLTDPSHSLKLGRVVSAESLLAIRILEDGNSLLLTSRLILSETGSTMEMVSLKSEKSVSGLREIAAKLSSALLQQLPLAEGEVISRDTGNAYVKINGVSTLPKGMHLIFYRRGKEIRHPVSGRSLGFDMTILSDAPIAETAKGLFTVRLTERLKAADIRPGDLAVTR